LSYPDHGIKWFSISPALQSPRRPKAAQAHGTFLRSEFFAFQGGNISWKTGGNGFKQIQGWDLFTTLGAPTYANNTILGTIELRFRRISNTALFTSVLTPTATFAFTNGTLFNPALSPTWDWDFGDGTAHVTTFNASHTYCGNAKYVVTLTSTDPIETKSFTQIMDLSLKADFSYSARYTFVGGLPVSQVTLTNTSNGGKITTYHWDFGDGSAHGTTANPVHNIPSARA
jgi:PKD repeat protein